MSHRLYTARPHTSPVPFTYTMLLLIMLPVVLCVLPTSIPVHPLMA